VMTKRVPGPVVYEKGVSQAVGNLFAVGF
jgi:hypothetical protein